MDGFAVNLILAHPHKYNNQSPDFATYFRCFENLHDGIPNYDSKFETYFTLSSDLLRYPDVKDNIVVKYNGTPLPFEQSPIIADGIVLVPLRKLFKNLNYQVVWEQETKFNAPVVKTIFLKNLDFIRLPRSQAPHFFKVGNVCGSLDNGL